MGLLALFGTIGTWEMVVILGLGLLLFGRRLPEVGRSLGKGIVEFKKGLKGIEDEIEEQTNRPTKARTNELPEGRSAVATGTPAAAGMGGAAAGGMEDGSAEHPADVRVSRKDVVE